MLKVSLLAVLQGIAEFLPISSSGHLVLGKNLLGLENTGMRLDIFLHVGTLLAVVAFYFKIVLGIFLGALKGGASRKESLSYVGKILLSAIPVGAIGVAFSDFIAETFSSSSSVSCALLFTGAVLISTRFVSVRNGDLTLKSAIFMGLAQALAIIPGVSRSGMTLSAAKLLGVDSGKAAQFSFLMSLPPIAGAALLEVYKSLESASVSAQEVSWGLTIYGAFLAAIVGWISLAILLKMLRGNKFWLFGVYCIAVSAVVLIFTK